MDKIEPLKLHTPTRGADGADKQDKKDFCIKVEDVRIHVNKDFMCTVSEYFRVMVESGMTESEDGILDVKKTTPHVVQTVIKYLYGERVSIPWDEVKDYVDFAELWQLPTLKSSLEDYIASHILANECIEWFYFADMYNMERVKIRVKHKLKTDFLEAFQSAYFKALEYERLVDFLKKKELCLSPDAVLEACISWTKAEESTRRPMFEDLLPHVLISKCNHAKLKSLLEKQDLITSQSVSAKIDDIIKSSIMFILPIPVVAATLNIDDLIHGDVGVFLSNLPFSNPSPMSPNPHVKTNDGIFSTWRKTPDQWECILWDPASLEVTHLPPITLSRAIDVQTAVVNTQLFVKARRIGETLSKSAHMLFQINAKSCDQWQEILLPEIVKLASYYLMCSHGKFLFISSQNKDDDIKLHCYDTEHGTWTEKARPPAHLTAFVELTCVVPALGCLYFIGNFRRRVKGKSQGLQKLGLRYSIALDKWVELSPPPRKSRLKQAVFLEKHGAIYEFIGSEFGYEDMIQIYNIAFDVWEAFPCRMPPQFVNNSFCCTV